MCYLQYSLDEDDYDYDREYSPAPRPLPRLRWAIPVDAVKLGASLTAYEEQLPRTNALRLCHRFGDGLLSTIPQEILDLIVRKLYLSSRQAKLSEWDSTSKCFQGRCRRSHHVKLDDDEVEGMWNAFYNNQAGCCERHRRDEDLDPADYDNEEKRKMVDDYIDNDGDLLFDSVSEAHEMARDRWLDMLCLCKDSPRPHSAPKTFKHLQTILKSHFGIEATLLHEQFSYLLKQFLPDTYGPDGPSYYTSCFLTLPEHSPVDAASRGRTKEHTNNVFLNSDNHLAFHRKIDLTSFDISDQQKSAFARTLHILDLRPSFHMTELEASLAPSTVDKALWKISDRQLLGCPKISSASLDTKKWRLKQYLKRQDKELQKQSWPQLMLMAASNVVAPSS